MSQGAACARHASQDPLETGWGGAGNQTEAEEVDKHFAKKRSVSVIDVPGILIRSGAGDFGVCQDCPMGFFGNFSGMSECEPCAAGSFSNQSGVSSSAGPRNSSFKECVNMCRHHMVFDAVLNKLPPIRLEYRREEQQKSFFSPAQVMSVCSAFRAQLATLAPPFVVIVKQDWAAMTRTDFWFKASLPLGNSIPSISTLWFHSISSYDFTISMYSNHSQF